MAGMKSFRICLSIASFAGNASLTSSSKVLVFVPAPTSSSTPVPVDDDDDDDDDEGATFFASPPSPKE